MREGESERKKKERAQNHTNKIIYKEEEYKTSINKTQNKHRQPDTLEENQTPILTEKKIKKQTN